MIKLRKDKILGKLFCVAGQCYGMALYINHYEDVGTRHGVSLRSDNEDNVGPCHGMALHGTTLQLDCGENETCHGPTPIFIDNFLK